MGSVWGECFLPTAEAVGYANPAAMRLWWCVAGMTMAWMAAGLLLRLCDGSVTVVAGGIFQGARYAVVWFPGGSRIAAGLM